MGKAEYLHILEEHVHQPMEVYPTMAGGVTLIADNGAIWSEGVKVEIIPAGQIAAIFDIHWVNIERLSANAVYEGVLYTGAALSEVFAGRFRVTRSAVQNAQSQVFMMTKRIPANTRISGAIASSSGNADQMDTSLSYHIY